MPRRIPSLFLILLALAGCRRGPPREAGIALLPAGSQIVLISIDTLRADHLPAYGYKGVETPALDSLRKDAILFESAISHCPLTSPLTCRSSRACSRRSTGCATTSATTLTARPTLPSRGF